MKNKDIAKLIGKSPAYVSMAVSGKLDPGTGMLERITGLVGFEDNLAELFTTPAFIEMCDVAINKARSGKIREFASICKHTSVILQKKIVKKEYEKEALNN